MELLCLSMTCWSSVVLLVLVLWNVALAFAQPGAADALLAFKHAVGDPPTLHSWSGDPCYASWRGVHCTGMQHVISLKLSNFGLTGLISPALENLTSLISLWLDGNHLSGSIPSGLGKLKNLTSLRLSGNNLNGDIPVSLASLSNLEELFLDGNQLNGTLPFLEIPKQMTIRLDANADLCSPIGRSNLSSCAPSLAPALVFGPGEGMPQNQTGKKESHVGAIAGGVAGAVVLVAISIALVSLCLLRVKRWPSATSDTGSSDPSAQVDWAKGPESPLVEGVLSSIVEAQPARQFSFQELDHATKSFNPTNLIGKGRFGFVYKGLLEDGTIVAIKTRTSNPTQEFITEVVNLSQVRNKHVVSLLGFCQEHEQQMLVYDYLPNGSVCSHLYDSTANPVGDLDLRQRISIALGAAKGLEYLHTRTPPLLHQDFKTSNVLLDENVLAKVTDVGLSRLLPTSHAAMPSSNGASTHGFVDPACNNSHFQMDQRSDVYSFGVFLLELISGREAVNRRRPQPEWSLVNWAQSLRDLDNLETVVDRSLAGTSTENVQRLLLLALQCTEVPDKRPTISAVAKELEQILEKERGVAAEGTTVVTLGSELFT